MIRAAPSSCRRTSRANLRLGTTAALGRALLGRDLGALLSSFGKPDGNGLLAVRHLLPSQAVLELEEAQDTSVAMGKHLERVILLDRHAKAVTAVKRLVVSYGTVNLAALCATQGNCNTQSITVGSNVFNAVA